MRKVPKCSFEHREEDPTGEEENCNENGSVEKVACSIVSSEGGDSSLEVVRVDHGSQGNKDKSQWEAH